MAGHLTTKVQTDIAATSKAEGVVEERERCANIVDHAFDHMSPLAIYESYRGGDRPVTRLNTERSAAAIAAKIRGGE